jgi:hypothetical protein
VWFEEREPEEVAYRDLAGLYRGPGLDKLGEDGLAINLRYRPADRHHFFAALLVTGLNDEGAPVTDESSIAQPYAGAPCIEECIEVEIEVDAYGGLLRLPVAVGHVVDPDSVFLDGQQLIPEATTAGEPVVRLARRQAGLLRYLSAPGTIVDTEVPRSWPPLPPEVQGLALALDELPVDERARAAADFVRGVVRYDRSPEIIERHLEEKDEGLGLFHRTLDIGAGDCDIQNALLVAMLDHAQVPARLAIGWVGVEGRASPGLHAWAEYLDENGRWRAVDASTVEVAQSTEIVEEVTETTPGLLPDGETRNWWWVGAIASLPVLVVALALLTGRRAWQRSFRAGAKSDLAGLLSGAALRPKAFAGVHALFERKVVPLLSGRPISLSRAQEEMRRGRLAWARWQSGLAERAARAGCTVLDGASREGMAVAKALGALDLDRWHSILDRSRSELVTERVEEALRGEGEACRVLVAPEVGEAVAMLDGAPLGLGRRERWVVVDEQSDLWLAVQTFEEEKPAVAALVLADVIVPRVSSTPFVEGRCLAVLADAAARDQIGGCA